MKFTSIFFYNEYQYLRGYLKDTNKRAKNRELARVFFSASAGFSSWCIKLW